MGRQTNSTPAESALLKLMRIRSTLVRSALVGLTLAALGCGEAPPATVSGVITIDGSPLPAAANISGTVMFYPVARGAAGYGAVHAGRYEVKTGSSAGLEPGEYAVTVRIVEIGPPTTSGAAPPQTLLHPGHYEQRKHSGLSFEVKPGANTYDIPLKRQ